MFGIQHYFAFMGAVVAFQLIPGPGTLAILSATARQGVRVGIAAVAGTLLGDFAMMVAAMAGLAALMRSTPLAFHLLQWFGAAYLAWIGLGLLRMQSSATQQQAQPSRSAFFFFRQACVVSLTNSKVMVFFVGFFPPFIQPNAATATLVALVLHVSVISCIYQTGLVLLGNQVVQYLKAIPAAGKIASRVVGVVLMVFAVKLATSQI